MQLGKRIAGGAATGALLCGGLFATAGSASAVPDTTTDDGESQAQAWTVTTWTGGPLRAWHDIRSPVSKRVGANTTITARCWLYSQKLTRWGITNNVWVSTPTQQYIWAGLLKGDRYGNLPASARC